MPGVRLSGHDRGTSRALLGRANAALAHPFLDWGRPHAQGRLPCLWLRQESSGHRAQDEGTTLRDAALKSGAISAEEFDRLVVPQQMVGNPQKDLELV